jgi:hypothetical protein
MIIFFIALILMGAINPAFALVTESSLQSTAVSIPGGEKGIGLDDVNYSRDLHKLLVPAGFTGKLYLIDPSSFAMDSVQGFTSSTENKKGHEVGISSADAGEGFIFVADHGTHQLDAVDVKTGIIVASAPLAGDPDIIRYAGNHEVWVTQPDDKIKKQIEVFVLKPGDKPLLTHELNISVPDGPESLTIDQTNQHAYTNLGKQVGEFDLHTHAMIAQWPNDCEKSRGTAVDGPRGFLFVGCGEGKAEVFDLNQKGKKVGSLLTGPGVDLIDYNASLSHLYITGSKSATLSVLRVSSTGELSLLGVGQAALRSHCVAGDDKDNIWVCDPTHGQLLRYKDIFPVVK